MSLSLRILAPKNKINFVNMHGNTIKNPCSQAKKKKKIVNIFTIKNPCSQKKSFFFWIKIKYELILLRKCDE